MKKNIFLALLVGLSAALGAQAETYSHDKSPTVAVYSDADQQGGHKRMPITNGANVMVQYAFPPEIKQLYGVRCSFISESMLKQAGHLLKIQNVSWNIDGVINRLTALLSIHTNEYRATKNFKNILKDIQNKNLYSLLIEYHTNEGDFTVLYHPTSKDKLDEILLFHFGKDNTTNILQFTGNLKLSDMGNIMNFTK